MNVDKSAGVMINNDQEWWIAGGAPHTSDAVIFDGTLFSPYYSLPNSDYTHHLIALNDTHVIYLDGDYVSNTEQIFDLTTNPWTPFTSLPRVG